MSSPRGHISSQESSSFWLVLVTIEAICDCSDKDLEVRKWLTDRIYHATRLRSTQSWDVCLRLTSCRDEGLLLQSPLLAVCWQSCENCGYVSNVSLSKETMEPTDSSPFSPTLSSSLLSSSSTTSASPIRARLFAGSFPFLWLRPCLPARPFPLL